MNGFLHILMTPVFGHENNPANLKRWPRVVVISYTMLHRLHKSMLDREWALLIVDESHHVRCTKKASEPREVKHIPFHVKYQMIPMTLIKFGLMRPWWYKLLQNLDRLFIIVFTRK